MNRAQEKTRRVLAAINHQEADRVPIGEFFWTNFIKRLKQEWGVDGFDPYRHWDLDMIVINPNMDPHIKPITILEDSPRRKLLKTGFEATIEVRHPNPMPHFNDFDTKSFEQIEAFQFDNPLDRRRYFEAGDDQINSVGDALNLGLPAFVDRVKAYTDDFCVFGSVCEAHEMMWRIVGTENLMMKIAQDPDAIARFADRIGDFCVGIVKGQIAAAEGRLAGLYVWGDVAFDRGMFFSPDFYRYAFKPQLKKICDAVHAAGLKTIYHGCGDARKVYEDILEAGIDMYNPLEAKAGLDVVEIKRQYGPRWGFNGNIDVRVLATGDRERVRREVLRKLNAAKGGGYILQSDHSIPDNVPPDIYDYVVQLARQHGRYPLDLGEFDEPMD